MSYDSETDALAKDIVRIISKEKPGNVNQLLTLLLERYQLTQVQALETIASLQARGKIRVETQPVRKSTDLASYLKKRQSLWYWITISASILAAIVISVVPENLPPWNYLRNVLGSAFLLLLPGYSFIRTLFPVKGFAGHPTKVSTENLDAVERTSLSLGMSLALAAILGLLLNYTPLGIRLIPVFWSLFLLTCAFATTAFIREYRGQNRLQILQVNQ